MNRTSPERTCICFVQAPGGTPGLGPLEIKSMRSGIVDHLGDGNWGCKPKRQLDGGFSTLLHCSVR